MSRKMICYDTQSCVRCFSCMVNCSVENRVRLQRNGKENVEKSLNADYPHLDCLTPIRKEFGKYPDARQITAFHHCNHCENAPCKNFCPTGAIEKRQTGAIVINEKTCIGCRACIDACPYDVPVFNAATNRTYKCILCYDRVENGLQQSCVEACPTNAMFSGDEAEVIAEAQARADRYSQAFNEPYIVYGKDRVNGYVGNLGWLTIAPEKDVAHYMLPADPYKASMLFHSFARTSGAAVAALTAVGLGAHFVYWLAKRKEIISEYEEE